MKTLSRSQLRNYGPPVAALFDGHLLAQPKLLPSRRQMQIHVEALPRGPIPAQRPFPVPNGPQQPSQPAAYQAELRRMQAALIFEAQQGYCNFKGHNYFDRFAHQQLTTLQARVPASQQQFSSSLIAGLQAYTRMDLAARASLVRNALNLVASQLSLDVPASSSLDAASATAGAAFPSTPYFNTPVAAPSADRQIQMPQPGTAVDLAGTEGIPSASTSQPGGVSLPRLDEQGLHMPRLKSGLAQPLSHEAVQSSGSAITHPTSSDRSPPVPLQDARTYSSGMQQATASGHSMQPGVPAIELASQGPGIRRPSLPLTLSRGPSSKQTPQATGPAAPTLTTGNGLSQTAFQPSLTSPGSFVAPDSSRIPPKMQPLEPPRPARLMVALQQRALTRRSREEMLADANHAASGADVPPGVGTAVRSIEEALEMEGSGPLQPLSASAALVSEPTSEGVAALGSSTVRLRGKGAHRDTLFFKKNFEMAAADFASRTSGGRLGCLEAGKQLSPEWHKLRDQRLTASAFGNALGFWPDGRESLWEEKLGLREKFKGNAATAWGTKREAPALAHYKELTGHAVESCSFKVLREDDVHGWLGASPDGLVDGRIDQSESASEGLQASGAQDRMHGNGPGVLEIKCPWNRGNTALAKPYEQAPFYYMPQVQGLMDMFDREWCDLYCWTPNGSTIFHIPRDRQYWLSCFEVLAEFWWAHVVPAKHALALGTETDLDTLRPGRHHAATQGLKAASIRMAQNAAATHFAAASAHNQQ
ncbi:hypothetical protein WJX74_007980 [Apatococcus lobatus]|uniref:YqaJ viral recombinase domain-containing protein n=1 Tax=Apatococcus lobatus TaxID=904363 RepID=A0AAW1S407_9CHLO